MRKQIILIIIIAILALGLGAVLVLQRPAFPEPLRRILPQTQTNNQPQINKLCGDGICDVNEKANPNLCPQDCQEQTTIQPTNQPTVTPAKQQPLSTSEDSPSVQSQQPPPGQPKSQEQIAQDSPFATNHFGIPSGVARVKKITNTEEMEKAIETNIVLFKELGIQWARLHPNIFGTFGWSGVDADHNGKNLDFSKQDAMVKIAQDNNINLLAGISPLPTDSEWRTAQTYIPENKDAYSSYVKQLVERYDGDGKDDMSGLKSPIKYWQLENEPDLHNKFRAQSGNSTFSNAQEYYEVLKLTYKAVKETDSQASLLLNVVGYGQNSGDTSIEYFRQLSQLGASNYYDIFSYHVYPNSYETSILTELLRKFKQYSGNKPVWITESGINGKLGEKSEKDQAAWIIQHYISSIAGGVKKIVWLSLPDMSPNVPEETVAKYSGLTTFDSRKKLAYFTYRKMTETLEGSDWNNIQAIQEKDGVYIYKFTKQDKSIWVAWNDNSGSKQITISGIPSGSVKITEAVPKYKSGKDVTDYLTAFNIETKTASSGKITITLGDKPVFVEEE